MGGSASVQFRDNRRGHMNHHGAPWQQQQQQQPQSVLIAQSFPQSKQPSMASSSQPQPPQAPVQRQFAPPDNNFAPAAPLGQMVNRTAMDKETLLRYVQIEKDINRLEAMNVVEHLQIKWDELSGIEEEIRRLTATFQLRKEQTLKEKKDVDDLRQPSVRNFFADQAAFEERMSHEQEEYLAALNKQEVAQKELDAAMGVRESAKSVVKELHGVALKLRGLYKEQDTLLAAIFDGKYGSELEFRLEREHDAQSDRQQRIAAAKTRWQAGRLLVYHACAQLGHAVKQWEFCASVPTQAMQQRYVIATETRNYLISACANLRNSQSYLKGINFPYCRLEEVITLERAANNVYTDVATVDRHQHALTVYRAMSQRSAALLQWFDTVLDKTIDKDLLIATEEMFAKKRELRIERVRLIKEKLVELFGPAEAAVAGLDDDANLTDARRLQQQLESVNQEEMNKLMQNVKVVMPDGQPQGQAGSPPGILTQPATGAGKPKKSKKQSKRTDEAEQPHAELAVVAAAEPQQEVPVPTSTPSAPSPPSSPAPSQPSPPPPAMSNLPKIEAVALRDLAPPPSQEQLFGDIDSIKKQYEIDMEEYQRAQDMNRARVEQGLQTKLAARKSRKARKMEQEQETEKLLQASANA